MCLRGSRTSLLYINLGFLFATVNRVLLSYILFRADDKLKRCKFLFACCLDWQARRVSRVLPNCSSWRCRGM